MSLSSKLFAGDAKLEACLVNHAAHLVIGTRGEHVGKVQTALFLIDGLHIDATELRQEVYGKSTAAAVLAYKRKRHIINPSYQSSEDNIVGKMTIASLDADVVREELTPADFPLKPHNKEFI
jgi:hypothetical protein